MLILSTDIGEGHDLPARVLADDLRAAAPGSQVEIVDTISDMGGFVSGVIRDGMRFMIERANWLWDIVFWLVTFFWPTRRVMGGLAYLFGARTTLELIRDHDPDVVVSTYPGSSEILGQLKAAGRLKRPVVSAITDLSALTYWSHPGIDLHLITHPESADEVARIAGKREGIHTVRGLYKPEFAEHRDPLEARRALELPARGDVVVVSGGGWGVGDLEGALRVVLERPAATAICLCGRNEAVRERIEAAFAGEPRVLVVGFTDRMSDYLAAA
ncbi:MAG: processive 1,2-diacylglycerol beta-glucosyltransferase, partial [Thermoleophilaceae bacterium]|nr:processive 1,2-diacylglycerol beta-glucosyltransferase [Thermoleophilaceae bacterium]